MVMAKLEPIERLLKSRLKRQVQEGLSDIFNEVGCKAIAREINRGRNVKNNVRMGIKLCIHDKIGPKVDPDTLKFYPQTKKQKRMEEEFISGINKLLSAGGYGEIKSISKELGRKDMEFKKRIEKIRV